MLILVTMGLVAVAAVALAVGFVSNHLGPIYVSIVCSAMAGMVLALFARLGRRQAPVAAGTGPAPLPADLAMGFDRGRAPRPRSQPARWTAFDDDGDDDEDHVGEDEVYRGWAEEPLFPIEDYDDLRVADIVPLLSELDLDELAEVRAREASGKRRRTVLTRIHQLTGELEALSGSGTRARTATKRPGPNGHRNGKAPFPIADYDRLRATEIVALLTELDDDELEQVAARERAGAGRTTVLTRVGRLLGHPVAAGGRSGEKG